MFFKPEPPIGDFDPYTTLKELDTKMDELEMNLQRYIQNQQVLDGKLDDIARVLRMIPDDPIMPYLELDDKEKRRQAEDFDTSHQGGRFRQDSSRIKELLRNLGKRRSK